MIHRVNNINKKNKIAFSVCVCFVGKLKSELEWKGELAQTYTNNIEIWQNYNQEAQEFEMKNKGMREREKKANCQTYAHGSRPKTKHAI